MSKGLISGAMQERALALYNAGIFDPQIADQIGVHKCTVKAWRKAKGLPANVPPVVVMDRDAARRLYDLGKTDHQIGRELGFFRTTVGKWRKGLGLIPNGCKCEALSPELIRKVQRYLRQGLSTLEASREANVTHRAAQTIRFKMKAHPGLRKQNENSQTAHAVGRRDPVGLYNRIARAVGCKVTPDIADDAIGDMWIAIMVGRLKPENIERSASKFRGRVINQYASSFGPRSLDEEIGEDGFSIGELIEDPGALGAFDRINDEIDEAHEAVGW